MAAYTFDLHEEFNRIRQKGFPIYTLTRYEMRDELRSLLEWNRTGLIKEGVVGQTMHALGLAWHYQPHSWEVPCGGAKTPMEVFTDDVRLRRALGKCRKSDNPPTDADVRRVLRMSNAQGVSNFRPTAAASLFDRFLPQEGGVVWDMSGGWGGRLLGSIASKKVRKYIATDPSSLTMTGLREMAIDVVPMVQRLGYTTPDIEFYQCGSEDFTPAPNSLSLCATSPPYGSHERYSDEPTQSYIKFPTKEEWLHGFMGQTLRNCRIGLKSEGKLVINIAGVDSYPKLHTDFVALATSSGWVHEDTLSLRLSKPWGTPREVDETHKLEPIYVFRKAR